MLAPERHSFRSSARFIRTPDQRVRVFISSCIGELAEERTAVREAVQRLRLSPVLFEFGARPHPPRALYRAYLDQSHVFLGIYGRSYGWVAPGETVSGIEDEYDASADRPKLMYVKAGSESRDPRLEQLLHRIEADDAASYKQFASAQELKTLVEHDLSLLLSERFEASLHRTASDWISPGHVPLPAFTTTLVGREKAIKDVRALFSCRHARIVTLTGPGGIGKTRLALEVARRIARRFKDGAVAVFLAPIADPDDVAPGIAAALKLAETPGQTWLETLVEFLRERKLLLVLDNFEHLLSAAPTVSEILASCPAVRVLVTSREVLKITGEHGYEVEALEVPKSDGDVTAAATESVRLFNDRAAAVAPVFALDSRNIGAIGDICRRLDGLPLAVELAAARVRVLPIDEIRSRLDDVLGFLVHGPRDVPERQRTLRATIGWSHALLSECDRRLFARLGVFRGGCTVEAAAAVCDCGGDVLEELSSLVDKSLIRSFVPPDGEPRFTMLETIREFALEQLRASQDEDAVRARHAELFLAWVLRSADAYRAAPRQQRSWVNRVTQDLENLRAAMRWFLDHGRPGAVAEIGMALWEFWWIRGGMREAASWMQEALATGALSELERAMAQFIEGLAAYAQSDHPRTKQALSASYETFRRLGDDRAALVAVPYGAWVALAGDTRAGESIEEAALATSRAGGHQWQVGYSLLGIGRVLMLEGRVDQALAAQEEAVACLRSAGELMIRSLTLLSLGWAYLMVGRLDRAADVLREALGALTNLRNEEGLARALEAIGAVAARRGDAPSGAVMLGAAEGARRAIGARPWALDASARERVVEEIHRALGAQRFRDCFREGSALAIGSAVELARTLVPENGGPGATTTDGMGLPSLPVPRSMDDRPDRMVTH